MISAAPQSSSCPPANRLRALLLGSCSETLTEELHAHVDGCVECQSRLEEQSWDEDWLIRDLGPTAAKSALPETSEPECIDAIVHAARSIPAPMPAVDLGELLGPYQLVRPLGVGGMGTVYLARHTRLRRDVAIKLLPRMRGTSPAWRERFDREMAAMAALEHDNIVRATDAGEANGWHYLVMEHLDGLDLSRVARRLGPLAVRDACMIVIQAARGIAHIHDQGWVHRDVKPSNVMLTRGGSVKLLDLGLVLSGDSFMADQDRLTTVGHLMGTVAFMAPEQLTDSASVDARADVYSLAATLFRLITGHDPHQAGANLPASILSKTTQPPRDARSLKTELPVELSNLLTRALSADRELRPTTIDEFAHSLEPFAAGGDPRRVIQCALRVEQDESMPPSISPPSALSSGKIVDVDQGTAMAGGGSRRRGWAWISVSLFPWFLLVAGIIVAIQTDRGQLVIESPQDNLQVSIKRNDEFVERLILKTGDNKTTLRSGTYVIDLEVETDGWELSEDRILLTRGGEETVRIKQVREGVASEPTAAAPYPTEKTFQGKPFGHWLAITENERDVEMICEAARALAVLADTPERRRTAAATLMRTARTYGGFIAGSGGPSGDFMNEFPELMQAFLPDPGIAVIANELQQGNLQSTFASIWILNNYFSGVKSVDGIEAQEPYQQWSSSGTSAVEETKHQLLKGLQKSFETLGGLSRLENFPLAERSASAQFTEEKVALSAMRIARMLAVQLGIDGTGRTLSVEETQPIAKSVLVDAMKVNQAIAEGQQFTYARELSLPETLFAAKLRPEGLEHCRAASLFLRPYTAELLTIWEKIESGIQKDAEQQPQKWANVAISVVQHRMKGQNSYSYGYGSGGGMGGGSNPYTGSEGALKVLVGLAKQEGVQLSDDQRHVLTMLYTQLFGVEVGVQSTDADLKQLLSAFVTE